MSMGQEIGVTPIQVISMISTVANDGVYTPPRIVVGETPAGTSLSSVSFHPAAQHRVISAETAAKMKRMMEGVVLYGTARRAQLNGYTSAGKTGTAQKVDPHTHTYSKTAYIGSFAGFAPLQHPAVSILVSLDSPKGAHQGGQISAPVFARIAQQVLEYMNVPHDIPVKGNPERLQASAAQPDDEDDATDHLGAALDWAGESSATPAVPESEKQPMAASGKLPKLTPEAPAPEVPQKPLSGMVEISGGSVVPSFLGRTLRSAVTLAQQSGFDLEVVGSGVAREQYPSPGSHIASGSRVTVRFRR
jgi:cell division protein FtsI (penicillin-binding protein 3)